MTTDTLNAALSGTFELGGIVPVNRVGFGAMRIRGPGCTVEALAFIPWYPLLVGKIGASNAAVSRIAQRVGATPSQVALAWLLQRSPVMLPIAGTSRHAPRGKCRRSRDRTFRGGFHRAGVTECRNSVLRFGTDSERGAGLEPDATTGNSRRRRDGQEVDREEVRT